MGNQLGITGRVLTPPVALTVIALTEKPAMLASYLATRIHCATLRDHPLRPWVNGERGGVRGLPTYAGEKGTP